MHCLNAKSVSEIGRVNYPLVCYIDLKRITRCKLALIFTSADHRKFLGFFGSEAARL